MTKKKKAKKSKQTRGGGSLRKAMKSAGAFRHKGPEQPKSPPGEVEKKPGDKK